jgi:hypothetical protein
VKKRKKKAKFVCGTSVGYIRHLRKYERPCGDCLVGSETYTEAEIIGLIEDFQSWSNEQHLWRTYQLSHKRFEQIFAEQGRCCACCLNTDSGEAPWHIDHDHQTGLIRGILCSSCNTGIGQLGDDLRSLQQAVTYLQAHEARGGYEKAQKPPKSQRPFPKISVLMRQCFDLFKQGVPCDKVVIILRLTPATVNEIYAQWGTRGGEIDPISRLIFQIPKDLPQRFMCACGYSAPWKGPDDINIAVDLVNTHIKEADSDPEAEWKRLETEERDRRFKEEQLENKERRQRIAEELRQKTEIAQLRQAEGSANQTGPDT